MYNALTRLQTVFGFFTTVVTVVAGAIAVLSLLTAPVPELKEHSLELKNVAVVKGRPNYYSPKKAEYAHITFDLDLNINELFTWNTKQVFLYVTASYAPPAKAKPGTPPSTAIIWDAILPHPLAPAHVNTYVPPSQRPKSKRNKSNTKDSKANSPTRDPAKAGILALSGQKPKYQITDVTGKIADRGNATLLLNWNVQPWVGALTWGSSGLSGGSWWETWRGVKGGRSQQFDFPPLKDKKEAAKDTGGKDLDVEKGGEGYRLMG